MEVTDSLYFLSSPTGDSRADEAMSTSPSGGLAATDIFVRWGQALAARITGFSSALPQRLPELPAMPAMPQLPENFPSLPTMESLQGMAEAVQDKIIDRESRMAFQNAVGLLSRFFGDAKYSTVELVLARELLTHHCQPNKLPPSPIPVPEEVLDEGRRYMRLATAAYGWRLIYGLGLAGGMADVAGTVAMSNEHADMEAIIRHTGLRTTDILHYQTKGPSVYQPAYIMVADPVHKKLVLSIRGTLSISDTLTDLVADRAPYLTGAAHCGIAMSADYLYEHSKELLQSNMRMVPDYSLVIVGHSLGAGCAMLLTARFLSEDPTMNVRCYGFGTPPVLSRELATSPLYTERMTNFILNDDVVARLSVGSVTDLKTMMTKIVESLSENRMTRLLQLMVAGNATLTTNLSRLTSTELGFEIRGIPLAPEDRTERLYIPGRIVHIEKRAVELIDPEYVDVDPVYTYHAVYQSPLAFEDIVFSADMYTDHVPSTYEKVLATLGSTTTPNMRRHRDALADEVLDQTMEVVFSHV